VAGAQQFVEARQQVVARHDAHPELAFHAVPLGETEHRPGAALRVDPSGVGDDPHAAPDDGG
jgi:hypothetical protein